MTAIEKEALRKVALAARARLAPEERAEASRAALRHLVALEEFARAGTIGIYAPLGSELDPLALAAPDASSDRRFAFPRMVEGERALAFAICAPEELVPGALGTREPPGRAAPLALEELDLVLVPGVAFDLEGGRLGRGRGYYDALLASLSPRTRRWGLLFEVQLVPRVPREPHDRPLDGLVTEARSVQCGAGRPARRPIR
ncbi:MAG TPA: 5-formyltetrahydrofolate cyclo-ligase [Anaeromyxobacteraceae bacterium]|nr:5-formyltetrahydrofolate cyclo-ligase [Anaeromyxobacteraceae bacterium]